MEIPMKEAPGAFAVAMMNSQADLRAFKSLQHNKIYDGRQEVGESLTGVEQVRTTQKLLSPCAGRQWKKEGKRERQKTATGNC